MDAMVGGLVGVVVALWTAFVVLVTVLVSAPHPEPVRLDLRGGSFAPIAEDDPRWDCRTMGNRTCGR